MGLVPSKTELLLPADTIKPCHPDRCWCNGGNHRSLKWVYTERNGDGRERYHDAVDMMQELMMGMDGGIGGGGRGTSTISMPWRPAKEWTVRDYERLGEVLNEYYMRENGKRMGGRGERMYGPSGGRGGGGGGFHYDDGGSSYGGGRRRHRYPSWNEFEKMQHSVDEKFRQMAEYYQSHMRESDAFLFGSEEDMRKERYRNNMLKTMQELLPQLAQMMGSSSWRGDGVPPMMPPQAGMPGNNPWAGSGMAGGGMGMGMGLGMGANPAATGMNPMAAAAMAQGMANQHQMPPHQPWMDPSMSMNNAWGQGWPPQYPRAPLRKKRLNDGPFATPDFGMNGPYGRNRWDYGDDMLGGGGGYPGSDLPGGPKIPRRPPPDYPPGGLGGAAMPFDDDEAFYGRPNPLDPRSGLAHGHRHHSDSICDPILDRYRRSGRRRPPSPSGPGIRVCPESPPYPRTTDEPMMSGGLGPRSPPRRTTGDYIDSTRATVDSTDYPATAGAYATGPNIDPPCYRYEFVGPRTGVDGRRRACMRGGYHPEAPLVQPRDVEKDRDEIPLGSKAQKRGI